MASFVQDDQFDPEGPRRDICPVMQSRWLGWISQRSWPGADAEEADPE